MSVQCACQTGGAYRPACSVPGGCGTTGVPGPVYTATATTGLCVFDHGTDAQDQPKYENATTGRLCDRHRTHLDTLTSDIHSLLMQLPAIRQPETHGMDTAGTRHTKSDTTPAPANLHMLDLLDHRGDRDQSVSAGLRFWVLCVGEARQIDAKKLPSYPIAQLDFLTRHHNWIADQPAVIDYHDALTGLRGLLRGALGTPQYDGRVWRGTPQQIARKAVTK